MLTNILDGVAQGSLGEKGVRTERNVQKIISKLNEQKWSVDQDKLKNKLPLGLPYYLSDEYRNTAKEALKRSYEVEFDIKDKTSFSDNFDKVFDEFTVEELLEEKPIDIKDVPKGSYQYVKQILQTSIISTIIEVVVAKAMGASPAGLNSNYQANVINIIASLKKNKYEF
jgi:hypothetical protein